MSVSWTLLLAGCSTESGTDAPQRAIGFTTTVTRSAVTSLGNDGDAFSVWAREIPSGGTPRLILTRKAVTCTGGSWQYDDLQYWRDEAMYDFYALYPAGQEAELENHTVAGEIPYLRIRDFDATRSVDLMTAEKTGLAYRPPAQRVAFTFRHLLSQIQIIGRIDPALAASGVSATIRSVKLYGMPGTGECAVQPEGNGTWSLGEATDADNPFARDTVSRELTPAGISVFADDPLLFPQQVGDGFVLEIEERHERHVRKEHQPRRRRHWHMGSGMQLPLYLHGGQRVHPVRETGGHSLVFGLGRQHHGRMIPE